MSQRTTCMFEQHNPTSAHTHTHNIARQITRYVSKHTAKVGITLLGKYTQVPL